MRVFEVLENIGNYGCNMKSKQRRSSKATLSDKIADALTVKPRADIEDDQVFGTKPHTVCRSEFSSSEGEDDAAISDFRKRNVNLLSEISKKYVGQVISQKEQKGSESEGYEQSDSENEDNQLSPQNLYKNDEDSNDDLSDLVSKQQLKRTQKVALDSEEFSSDGDGESDDYSITKLKKQLDDEESDDSDVNDDDNEEVDYDISQLEEPVKEEFEHVKKQNITEEAKKGACVRNQLLIWEGLLEMRIHLQRCTNTANQMPMPDIYEELKKKKEFEEECNATKSNISNVLDKFLILQNMLFKNYPETKTLSLKKQADKHIQDLKEESEEEIPSDTDNEEIPSDTEPEEEDNVKQDTKVTNRVKNNMETKKRKLEDYENEMATSHKSFKTFRDTTIQKWNEKTRLATATNIKNTPTNTILQQISYILSDKDKLVRRTRLKRSEYDIVGYKKQSLEEDQETTEINTVTKDRKHNDEYISEIFDDSDFYHQLLRELIECKSTDISDPVQLSRQWIALQQMRSKMKRKVDTKATKGRKIKYVVHNKLVNYMAPEKCTTWTDESTNELYSSLFGKMFEHNNIGLNANLENCLKIKN